MISRIITIKSGVYYQEDTLILKELFYKGGLYCTFLGENEIPSVEKVRKIPDVAKVLLEQNYYYLGPI